MSSKPGIIGRYRPRVVTLLVLLAVTAATVLANGIPQDVKRVSGTPSRYCQEFDYGWPLVWCRRGLTRQPAPAGAAAPGAKQGWPGAWIETWHVEHYRLPALAVNLATWLAFLAAARSSAAECRSSMPGFTSAPGKTRSVALRRSTFLYHAASPRASRASIPFRPPRSF